MKTGLYCLIPAILILTIAPSGRAQGSEPAKTEIQGHTMYTLLGPGAIPAIFEPEFVTAAQAESTYYEHELLLVVTGGKAAKAYSTWHLDRHEVVNDFIDGAAIVVTWYPLCYTGIVYAAMVDTARLTFQASGSLWQDALVMQDLQTGSLWSQVSGECISGPMIGTRLELHPSMQTTFAQFAKLYPDGLLLTKLQKGEPGSDFSDRFASRERIGASGRVNQSEQLDGKAKVFGIRQGGQAVAISENYLIEHAYATTTVVSPPVLVTFDQVSHTVAAFSLDLFTANELTRLQVTREVIINPSANRKWNSRTGAALTDDTDDLQPAPVVSAFWFAWVTFFPQTELVK
ncbi:MAG: DUF3179 domain-containing (seleno)protein [bacterium]